MMNEPALLRLSQGPFTALYRSRATRIDHGTITVGPSYVARDSDRMQKIPADTVVFVSHNRPNRGLYNDLLQRGVKVSVVGDANTPRFLQAAIREGHLAGAAI